METQNPFEQLVLQNLKEIKDEQKIHNEEIKKINTWKSTMSFSKLTIMAIISSAIVLVSKIF